MIKKRLLFVAAFVALNTFSIVNVPVAEAGWSNIGGFINKTFNRSKKPARIERGTIMQLENGISYQIVDNANNYEEAYKYASSVDGRLAILNNFSDCQMLYNFMVAQKIDSAYIGLADHMFNGKWRWPNGTSPKFYNWKKGEPNRSSKKNMYVMLSKENKKGTWSTGTFRRKTKDERPLFYIIQWNPNEKTVNVETKKPNYNSGASTYYPGNEEIEDVIEG